MNKRQLKVRAGSRQKRCFWIREHYPWVCVIVLFLRAYTMIPASPLTVTNTSDFNVNTTPVCRSYQPERNNNVDNELLVCGWDEVMIFACDKRDASGRMAKIWSWKAAQRIDLPEVMRGRFATTDECKPCETGSNILITASSGGVAYVRRIDGSVLFYAQVSNAHSAELLPGGRIAVAVSFCSRGEGDRLTLFDLDRPDLPLRHEALPGGHGVVWDESRQRLWALSYVDLRVFTLEAWDTDQPQLVKVETILLPERGGHDLYSVPDSADLFVTTGSRVWLFNRDTKTFRPHPELGDLSNVKSVNQHPVTGEIVYVKADAPNWWSASLHFLNLKSVFTVPEEHFYKARWQCFSKSAIPLCH